MDRFGVSVKGVLEINGKFLLRKNERNEYELLGGRLEKGDVSVEHRVITEFAEESGIKAEAICHREPWLYEIGTKNIIIVPLVCKATFVPDTLVDEDGGTLHWIDQSEIKSIFMPQGYKDTINNEIPHKSYSIPAKFFFKIIPNYVERDYYVNIAVKENNRTILSVPLPHFYSPRDYIYAKLGEEYKDAKMESFPVDIDYDNDAITLNYVISDKGNS